MFDLLVPEAALYVLIMCVTVLSSEFMLGRYIKKKYAVLRRITLIMAIYVGVLILVRPNQWLYFELVTVVLIYVWTRAFALAMGVERLTSKGMWRDGGIALLLLVVGGALIQQVSYETLTLYWRAVIVTSSTLLVWRFVSASFVQSNVYLFAVGCGFAILGGFLAASTFLPWDSLGGSDLVLPSIPSWFWFGVSVAWIFISFSITRHFFELHRGVTAVREAPALRATDRIQFPKQVLAMDRQRAMGMLASSLQHDLRQPLAAMLMNAQLILRSLKQGRVNKETIEMCLPELKQELGRFQDQIATIRNFVGASEVDDRELHDLRDIVNPLLQFVSPELSRSEVEFSLKVEPNLKIQTSKIALSQALLHLILNALESALAASSIRGGASISLEASSDKTNVFIRVKDTGFGMRQDQIKMAGREMFSTKSGRMGLGLLIVWQYVRDQGGTWYFDSAPDHFAVVLKFPVKS